LKIYDSVFQKLSKYKSLPIKEISSWVTQGPNPTFIESGYPCLTGRNINSGRVDYNNADYVSKDELENYKNYKIQFGDILITLKGQGSIGKIGFVFDTRDAIFSRNIGIIRSKNINPSYLHIFLISKYGKLLVDRGETGGTGQRTLTTTHLKENILVPRLSIESTIAELHIKSEGLYAKSKEVYFKCEEKLLTELGLKFWQPIEDNIAIKKFSNSFAIIGRLDAEYYQPKYDELFEELEKTKNNKLGNLAKINKSIEPGSQAYQDEGIPFVRVSDVSKFGLSQPEIFLDNNEYDIPGLKPKKDTILLSKDGSVGIAYKVEEDLNIITSGALLHLRINSKELLPDYLTLVLNSKVTQMQAERDAGGSIIQHWRPDQIHNVVIPIIPMEQQKELVKDIQKSFQLREQSNQLIIVARTAVEIAIEKDEKTALKYIEDSIQS